MLVTVTPFSLNFLKSFLSLTDFIFKLKSCLYENVCVHLVLLHKQLFLVMRVICQINIISLSYVDPLVM